MLPYIILFALSIFSISYCEIGKYKKYRKLLYDIIFIYAVLLAGLRYRVGGDTIMYMDGYNDIPTLSELSFTDFFYQMMEPFYLLLCVLVRMISSDFFVFQIIHALLVNYSIFHFIKKYSNYPFIGLFIYFQWFYFIFSYEFMREALAVSIMLFAFPYYQQRSWKKYYACVAIALLFHMSAIITFFFPLLSNIRFNRKFILFLIFDIILFSFLKNVFLSGISIFPYIDGKIYYYLHLQMPTTWIFQQIIPVVLVPIVCLIYNYKKRAFSIFENLVCIRVLLGLGIIFMPHVFYRFANYTVLPILLMLAEIIGPGLQRKVPINQYITSSICLFLTIILFSVFYITPISHTQRAYIRYVPYYSVLNPKYYQPREKVLAERDFYSKDFLEE